MRKSVEMVETLLEIIKATLESGEDVLNCQTRHRVTVQPLRQEAQRRDMNYKTLSKREEPIAEKL